MTKEEKNIARNKRRADRKTQKRLGDLISKYPNVDMKIIDDIFQFGRGIGQADEVRRQQVPNLETTKSFIEGVFLSGVQVGLMKREEKL